MINQFTTIALAIAARIAATATTSGVDVSRFTGLVKVVLNSSLTEGAGMTSDVKLQDSDDNTTFADVVVAGNVVAFGQVTSAANGGVQELLVPGDKLRKYVRTVSTLAGTSPFVTRGVTLIGRLAY